MTEECGSHVHGGLRGKWPNLDSATEGSFWLVLQSCQELWLFFPDVVAYFRDNIVWHFLIIATHGPCLAFGLNSWWAWLGLFVPPEIFWLFSPSLESGRRDNYIGCLWLFWGYETWSAAQNELWAETAWLLSPPWYAEHRSAHLACLLPALMAGVETHSVSRTFSQSVSLVWCWCSWWTSIAVLM